MLYESQKTMLSTHNNTEELHAVELLTARISRLQMTADNEMQRAGLANTDSFLYGTQRKVDRALGAVYQTVACTPLPCNVDTADELFWKSILEGLVHQQVRSLMGHAVQCVADARVSTFVRRLLLSVLRPTERHVLQRTNLATSTWP